MVDRIAQLQEEVKSANSIHIDSQWLNYSGIEEYFSEELVIGVKAGTSIADIQNTLAENNQTLPFYIGNESQSIGAAYAIGAQDLSDSVLGVKVIDGTGELLSFGGQVMKNVAGYDVSRMLVGSEGQLAIITQISFKVIPKSYIVSLEASYKTTERSVLRREIESRLKTVFDPKGIFN
ncbi:Glycolate dehydrogenase (EC 1.1.99.14), FAD-binding subunit GlcE [uncultured Gammaproteobacteria bacterium]|uniref:FAD-binding protein n=1 Tax=Bathymodiolus heckerae thiotrophic gill symbiont TaxID=1052212 RepID=UPI0010B64ED4|nr:FAD-binding protein [Bathymodiolus heckerae thiotrophic gill symbiont]CAC9599653.1 Glycolate dehydrogenase (EC 1.1.99.14), FAD-binding subunit GlcE [uncultured Gammaproteobacteria bacterium]CAC9950723.1 Glycolate dehydrogenase (EC 1.1.99.14), FAD-binding subunit GlcE [uncultured Gammaproteobacteria bacterium]SHN93380.1 Glycolate dehydrogenase, FAD-binding subunit GlcE [Bathymodiolus heckerae thiotrophic gill symbiont]